MSKQIEVSDETWEKIKDVVQKEGDKEKKKAKIEIKTIGGSLLWESEKETLKEAVEEAVSKDANLRGANLRGANLRGTNLGDANLEGAYLGDVNLEGANLRGANLRGANLRDADLGGTNLRDAYLEGADFYHTKLYGKGGTTKITKKQIPDFLIALGVIVE